MTGSRCEVPVQPIYHPTTRQIQPCSQNPCASGSTCLQTTQSPFPSCVCPPNRTGPTCNQVVTHAPPTYNPCNNNNINNPCSPVITTPFNPCQNNPCGSGQCHNNGFNNYMCQCPPNLTGQNCNQPIITTTPFNPCALNPCQTGTCINQGFSYTCQCPNGYSGQRCEIRNPCIDNPCRSGGTCVPGTNSFYCICNPLYTGSRCEIYAVITTTQNYHNPCQPNPCQYGGQCINQQQSQYVCSCRPQYTGSTCGKRIDSPSLIEDYLNSIPAKQYQPNPCSASPCQSGSTCININQPNVNPPYACVCPPNFTGPRCDQPLNPCGTSQNCNPVATPNPCQNINCNPVTTPNPCQNFNCNPVTTPNPCQNFNCNPVTTPNPCQNCNPNTLPPITTRPTLPPNPCSSNPCNSGTCHSSNQGYSCQCPSGFTGQNCNQVDMCTTNTCYNGGTCQTQRTGQDQYTVSCTCPPAYTGSRCQSPIVITTTRQTAPACQCMNNGVCQPSGQCQCQQNFYGQNCQYYTTTRPPCQCLNNGFCQPSGVCQCQNNYFGNNCQYRSNTLLPSSSESSSTCPAGLCVQGTCAVIPQGGASYCICNFGWTGPRCNIRNYCQSSTIPCKNGGTCVNGHNDYYCVCNSQTTGKYCEMRKYKYFICVFIRFLIMYIILIFNSNSKQ